MERELKGATLWHLEEVVEQSFECPYCGAEHHFRTEDQWHGVDDIIECSNCGEEFKLVDEDWGTA